MAGAKNILQVRWRSGVFEIEDSAAVAANGPKRGYLPLGQVETKAEARRIAQAELRRNALPLEEITLDADPRPVDALDGYGFGWRFGDYVLAPDRFGVDESVRVRAVAVTQDDESGELAIIPDLASRIDEHGLRIQRAVTRMLGTDGSAPVASPITTPSTIIGRQPRTTTQTFSFHGDPPPLEKSGPWTPEVAGRLAEVHAKLGTLDGTVPTKADVLVNGVVRSTAHIFPDLDAGWGWLNWPVGPGDKVEVETRETGGQNLVVRVIQLHYS